MHKCMFCHSKRWSAKWTPHMSCLSCYTHLFLDCEVCLDKPQILCAEKNAARVWSMNDLSLLPIISYVFIKFYGLHGMIKWWIICEHCFRDISIAELQTRLIAYSDIFPFFAQPYQYNVSTITSWMSRVIVDEFPANFPTSRHFEWSL